ncbi:MAG: ribose-5-phosphate isomerase RpiA [Alphaproteobacteria bacterium]|nr:ribose-5-phosphate isomerase RpiA [Alphaproteobacteria bacterium]MCB9929559.1 ribose-5-phosphate isomerase RpiA [Alphaproteobacteria bacterium]
MTLSPADAQKREAARKAVELVKDGMTLGLGTGSTAAWFVRLLGERVQQGLRVRGVPTSETTAKLANSLGIPVIGLDEVGFDNGRHIDLCVDGVDEVDGENRAIKGGGGALLREKIVASASDWVVYIADASKRVETLGRFPLPVEVIPFAAPFVASRIATHGCQPLLRRTAGGAEFRTDENNVVLDCPFDTIDDPESLAAELALLPGVVEHGLFLGIIDEMILADG